MPWPASDFYHLTPTQNRQYIQQHGLQPSKPANNEQWFYGYGEPDTWLQKQPEGIYAMPDSGMAEDVWGHDFSPYDVWKIPADQIQDLKKDPVAQGAWVIPHAVQPELVKGPEDQDESWYFTQQEKRKREQQGYPQWMTSSYDDEEDWGEVPQSYLQEASQIVPWSKGENGKAIIDDQGNMHHWRVNEYGEPHHDTVAQEKGINQKAKVDIHPNGAAMILMPDEAHLFDISREDAENQLRQNSNEGIRFAPGRFAKRNAEGQPVWLKSQKAPNALWAKIGKVQDNPIKEDWTVQDVPAGRDRGLPRVDVHHRPILAESHFKVQADVTDSDWGEDSDSGQIQEPSHYPNIKYNGWPGTKPFVYDHGSQKLYLGSPSHHPMDIHSRIDAVGPLTNGYVVEGNGRIHYDGDQPEEHSKIKTALQQHLKPDSWGTDADWPIDPIDGAGTQEFHPGIQA